MKEFIWQQKKVNVSYETDIAVVGGGTSGVIAAIAAANMGANVVLIERYGALGGTETMGLVTPIMPEGAPSGNAESAVSKEIRKRLTAKGYAHKFDGNYSSWFDTEMLKVELEEMVHEAGVKIMFETELVDVMTDGTQIDALLVHNKGGLTAIKASQYIDCTGDGDLSVMAGASYQSGGPDGRNQSVSLRYEMSGVDLKKFGEWLEAGGQDDGWTKPTLISTYKGGCPAFDKVMEQAIENGDVTADDLHYVQMFTMPGNPTAMNFNCPELGNSENVLDPEYISDRLYEGKRAVVRCAEFYKKYVPGFENSSLSKIAPMLGIRESRRIETEYMLSIDDIFAYRKFEDGISISDYKIDVHGHTKFAAISDKEYDHSLPREEWYFTMPYRSLVVKGIDNLSVAGRCAGADFFAQSAIRVQHMCRYMGEAAGIGAAMAGKENVAPKEIDGRLVRAQMAALGADL